MKTLTHRLLPYSLLLCWGFTACEVEFTPNADWKETPVVYCLLDQDDDTTWARIEKCYLGEGNIYQYASNSDSINYPSNAITAHLIAYGSHGESVDSLRFNETPVDRRNGAFTSQDQPTYYCLTRGWLNESYTYGLRVRRASDGKILCQTLYPISLISKTPTDSLITRPYSGRRFAFKDGNNTCQIEWNALANARLYQPYIRLYYESGGDTSYTDIMCQQVASRNSASHYSISYPKEAFLNSIKSNLGQDTSSKRYLAMVDIYLLSCSEDLKSYIYSASGQLTETYTNIENGVGVLAARRTHMFKRFPADDSDLRGGLRSDLRELNIGF